MHMENVQIALETHDFISSNQTQPESPAENFQDVLSSLVNKQNSFVEKDCKMNQNQEDNKSFENNKKENSANTDQSKAVDNSLIKEIIADNKNQKVNDDGKNEKADVSDQNQVQKEEVKEEIDGKVINKKQPEKQSAKQEKETKENEKTEDNEKKEPDLDLKKLKLNPKEKAATEASLNKLFLALKNRYLNGQKKEAGETDVLKNLDSAKLKDLDVKDLDVKDLDVKNLDLKDLDIDPKKIAELKKDIKSLLKNTLKDDGNEKKLLKQLYEALSPEPKKDLSKKELLQELLSMKNDKSGLVLKTEEKQNNLSNMLDLAKSKNNNFGKVKYVSDELKQVVKKLNVDSVTVEKKEDNVIKLKKNQLTNHLERLVVSKDTNKETSLDEKSKVLNSEKLISKENKGKKAIEQSSRQTEEKTIDIARLIKEKKQEAVLENRKKIPVFNAKPIEPKDKKVDIKNDAKINSKAKKADIQKNIDLKSDQKQTADDSKETLRLNPKTKSDSDVLKLNSKDYSKIMPTKQDIDVNNLKQQIVGIDDISSKEVSKPAEGKLPQFDNLKKQSELESKILDQVLNKVRINAKSGLSEVKISLSPPELGRMKLSFKMQGNELVVKISVENQVVKQALENNFVQLKQTLQEHNIKVSKLEVDINNQNTSEQNNLNSETKGQGQEQDMQFSNKTQKEKLAEILEFPDEDDSTKDENNLKSGTNLAIDYIV